MARFISKLALAVLCFSAADAKIHLPRIPHLPNMEAEMAIAKLVTSMTEMSASELVSEMKSIFPQAPVLDDGDKDEDVPIDSTASGSASLPVVILHGMGDSCFNPGMASITNVTGVYLNTYSVCIPGGSDLISDTLSGFLVNMDKNVDNFAKAVAADPKLSKGFYAIGFSQGNLILRGYLQRYNNPVAVRVLHVHGILQGVAAFPRCPDSSSLCQAFTRLLGSLAYNSLVQGILFQADYFRDPELVTSTNYKTTSQIANWNGENGAINPAYKENFLKTESLTHIKALSDSVVDPRESEWWGTYAPGSFTQVVPMEQTSWYVSDSFGLKTMHTQGRLSFNTSTGDHLRFTKAELFSWIEQAGFTN